MKHTDVNPKLNNMLHTDAHINLNVFKCLVWLVIMGYLFTCVMSFYKPVVYNNLLMDYMWIPAVAALCFGLYQNCYSGRKIYFAYLGLVIWLLITCWLKDDILLTDPANRTYLIAKCILCGLVLPFAHIMQDTVNRRHLDTFLSIIVTGIAAALWLCYIGALRGESFSLFGDRFMFGATYTYTDRMMLQFFNLYYYKTAYIAVLCFFTTLYLAVSHWTRRRSMIFIFLMLTFAAAIVITYSRTAVFTCLIGLLIALYILLRQLSISRVARIIILSASTVGGSLFAVAGLNYTYRFFNSIRDIWYGIETLTSRTDIWASIPGIIEDYPQALLYGLPIGDANAIMNQYIDLQDFIPNLHNGYLQTFILTGIPGLLAVIIFCIYLLYGSGRIIFSNKYKVRKQIAIKFMTIVPACCLIMNLLESLVFFNPVTTDFLNLIMGLFSGYIIEYAYYSKDTDNSTHKKNTQGII